jgi:hypothetical protein
MQPGVVAGHAGAALVSLPGYTGRDAGGQFLRPVVLGGYGKG